MVIRPLDGSRAKGFEELSSQLARCESPAGSHFERTGAPDAGVECYIVQPDGTEWGWQAKYFDSLGESQWQQLDSSVKTALSKHPRLVKYFVCLPIDRSDGRINGRKSARERWAEHVVKWEGWAGQRGMSVEFVYWGSHELLERLSRPEHVGRVRFWFDACGFDGVWFKARLDEALTTAGPRYTSELQVELPIALEFDSFGRSEKFFNQVKAGARNIRRDAQRLKYVAKSSETKQIEYKISGCCQKVDDILRKYEGIVPEPVGSLPFGEMASNLAGAAAICDEIQSELWDLEQQKRSTVSGQKRGASPRGDPRQEILSALNSLSRTLHEARRTLEHSCQLAEARLILLTGRAGTGKTHLLCDVANQRISAGKPTILIMGQRFVSTEPPWVQVLQQLDLMGFSAEDFVGALEAAAQAANARALVFIDALNEGSGRDIWPNNLAAFLVHLERSPWIGIVLSVRSSYEQLVISDNVRSQAHSIVHHGFEDHEYDATKTFFVHYGLELPSTPLLAPEFQNPLFLKTLCRGLHASGERRLPRGFQGLSLVFDIYLKDMNRRLAVQLGYNPNQDLVKQALSRFAAALVSSGDRWLLLTKAEDAINHDLPGREFERSLYRALVSEGLLLEELVWGSKNDQKAVVLISYDRLADHLVARTLIEAHVDKSDPAAAFAPEGPLAFLSDITRNISPGLIEAMCIQVPEHSGREFPPLVPQIQAWGIADAFRQSIVWRSPEAFTEETRTVLNRLIKSDSDWQQTLDVILTVATIPNHPFNASRLDKMLRPLKMPDRDQRWSIHIHQAWGRRTAVDRLVDWASAHERVDVFDDDAIDLCALSLAWMLTTSNRFLRDRATKALVNILTGRLNQVVSLIERFADLDDPYVVERVFAVANGVVLRSRDPVQVGEVARTVYGLIFARGRPPAHILLRDYARGVVERAIYLDPSFEVGRNLIRPPYDSDWPTIPSEDDIKVFQPDWSKSDDGTRRDWSHHHLVRSVLDDDFARYVVGTNSNITSWLSLRLNEPLWKSTDELTAEFLETLLPQEMGAWEKYTTTKDALHQVRLGAWVTRLKKDTADDAETPGCIESLSYEDALEAQGAVRAIRERDEALANLRSIIAPEKLARLEELILADRDSRRAPRFDLRLIQRYVLWRVFDLGWTTERFGVFDRTFVQDYGRDAHKAERIGKKYQWIAYHEILAFIADHFQYRGEFRGPEDKVYEGPWQDGLRDLDPSCIIQSTHGGTSWTGHKTAWWGAPSYSDWENPSEPKSWTKRTDDLPDPKSILSVTNPDDGTRWLNLQAYLHWEQPVSPDRERYESDRREILYIVTGYLIRKDDVASFLEWAKGVSFWGRWMPSPAELRQMFFGEHSWAPAAQYFERPYFGESGWSKPGKGCPVAVRAASLGYTQEGKGYDCSIDEGFELKLPVSDLVAGLSAHWTGKASDYVDADGVLVAFDPTADADGPTSFLVRRDALEEVLQHEDLAICWAIMGEKRVIPGERRSEQHFSLEISGAYALGSEGLDGFLQFETAGVGFREKSSAPPKSSAGEKKRVQGAVPTRRRASAKRQTKK
jgi:hypothetical protein